MECLQWGTLFVSFLSNNKDKLMRLAKEHLQVQWKRCEIFVVCIQTSKITENAFLSIINDFSVTPGYK